MTSVDDLAIIETCLDLKRYEPPLPTHSPVYPCGHPRHDRSTPIRNEWLDQWAADRRARDLLAMEVLRLRAMLSAPLVERGKQ